METLSLIIGIVIGFVIAFFVIRYFPSIFSGTTLCKPNYVFASPWISDDYCKSTCYGGWKITSYKKDISTSIGNYTSESCFCDINNCNPQ